MKSQKDVLKSLKIHVKRTNNKVLANEIRVKLTIEKPTGDYIFKDFSEDHIRNFELIETTQTESKERLGILKFDAHLIFKEKEVTENDKKPEKEYIIKNGIHADFKFDHAENSLLVVEVFADGIRPLGTKRKVITYEDSDLIDDTLKP
jgi:predicted DNA-binding ArsR family transcriptional regulator